MSLVPRTFPHVTEHHLGFDSCLQGEPHLLSGTGEGISFGSVGSGCLIGERMGLRVPSVSSPGGGVGSWHGLVISRLPQTGCISHRSAIFHLTFCGGEPIRQRGIIIPRVDNIGGRSCADACIRLLDFSAPCLICSWHLMVASCMCTCSDTCFALKQEQNECRVNTPFVTYPVALGLQDRERTVCSRPELSDLLSHPCPELSLP